MQLKSRHPSGVVPAARRPAEPGPGIVTPEDPRGNPGEDEAMPDTAGHVVDATGHMPPAVRGAEPGWGTVLGNTIRLWVQRRVTPRMSRVWPVVATLRFGVALAAAAVVLVAGGTITVALSHGTAPASKPRPGQQASTGTGADDATGAAGTGGRVATGTTAMRQAAQWVLHQAGSRAVVSCDPAMCSVLEQHGVPTGRLLTLRGGRSGPLGSSLMVATAALRSEFGSRLATVYAPVTLAVFGSGSTRVAIRVIAPDGAAAYKRALAADQRARRRMGRQIAVINPLITVSGAARRELLAGRVDARLLVTLTALAARQPLTILRFSASPGTGAARRVPLRSADITTGAAPGMLRHFYQARRPRFHPSTLNVLRTGPRGTVLRVGYPAPSPLGLLRTRS